MIIEKFSTAVLAKFNKKDVIVYSSPYDKDKKYIGRVVGLSNDWAKTLDDRGYYMHRRVPGGYCLIEELTLPTFEQSRGGDSSIPSNEAANVLRASGRSVEVSKALIHGKPCAFLWPFASVAVASSVGGRWSSENDDDNDDE